MKFKCKKGYYHELDKCWVLIEGEEYFLPSSIFPPRTFGQVDWQDHEKLDFYGIVAEQLRVFWVIKPEFYHKYDNTYTRFDEYFIDVQKHREEILNNILSE